MTDNQFDQLFRDKLDPYASPVNSEVLDRVFRERDKRKKRPGGLWYLLPALLLLTGLGYYALQKRNIDNTAQQLPANISDQNKSTTKNTGDDESSATSQEPTTANDNSTIALTDNSTKSKQGTDNGDNKSVSDRNSNNTRGVFSSDEELNRFGNSRGQKTTSLNHKGNRGLIDGNGGTEEFSQPIAATNNSSANSFNKYTILNLDPSLLSLSGSYDLSKSSKKSTLERGGHFPFCVPDCSFPGCPDFNGPRRNDWYLELFGSFDMPFKQLGNNSGKSDFVKRKDSTETMLPSFTFGFNVSKNITNDWLLKTGLRYSQINERFDYKNENERRLTTVITIHTIIRGPGDTLVVADTSFVEQTGTRVKRTYNKYRNIDIPLILSYEMRNPNFTIGVQAGLLFNLKSWYTGDMLDTSLVPMSQTGKDPKSQFKSNMGLGVYVGVSFIKPVSDTWEVYAEPYFKRYLDNHATSNAPFTQVLGSYGIQLGVRYKLNGSRQQNY